MLQYKAFCFALKAHGEQKRKYSGEPYIVHPVKVAMTVARYTEDEETIAAAYLHDTVEDCGILLSTIQHEFGTKVQLLVSELTNMENTDVELKKLPRFKRHELNINKLKNVSRTAKMIKLADRFCNLCDMDINNPECASFLRKKYLQESVDIINVCADGNGALTRALMDKIRHLCTQLRMNQLC